MVYTLYLRYDKIFEGACIDSPYLFEERGVADWWGTLNFNGWSGLPDKAFLVGFKSTDGVGLNHL